MWQRLPNRPRDTRWLAPAEAEALESHLEDERRTSRESHQQIHHLKAAFSGQRLWLLAVVYILVPQICQRGTADGKPIACNGQPDQCQSLRARCRRHDAGGAISRPSAGVQAACSTALGLCSGEAGTGHCQWWAA